MAATMKVIIDVDAKGQVKIKQFGKSLDTASLKASNLGKKMQVAGRQMKSFAKAAAAAGVAALGAGIALATRQFVSFEDTMLAVAAKMQATESEYLSLTAAAKNLGTTTRFTATEAAAGFEVLAVSGIKAADSMAALPKILNLAQAAAIGVSDAADILTGIMAQYRMEISDTEHISDVLVTAMTNSKAGVLDLGEAIRKVGGVAKSMGVDLEDTVTVLGMFANANIRGEESGTALRNVLLGLLKPMGNTGRLMEKLGIDATHLGVDLSSSAKALKSLGVESVDPLTGKLNKLPNIFKQIIMGLKKIPGEANQATTAVEIFGKRAGPHLVSALGQGMDKIEEFSRKLDDVDGVTLRIAEKMESKLGGAFRSFRSAVEGVGIALIEKFAPGMKTALDGITGVTREMAKALDGGVLAGWVKLFEGIVSGAGKAVKALIALKKAKDDIVASSVDAGKSIASAIGRGVSKIKDFVGATKEIDTLPFEALDQSIKALPPPIELLNSTLKDTYVRIDGVGRVSKLAAIELDNVAPAAEKAAADISSVWDEAKRLSDAPGMNLRFTGTDEDTGPLSEITRNARAELEGVRDSITSREITFDFKSKDGRSVSETIRAMGLDWGKLSDSMQSEMVAKLDESPVLRSLKNMMDYNREVWENAKRHADTYYQWLYGMQHRASEQAFRKEAFEQANESIFSNASAESATKIQSMPSFATGTGPQGLSKDGPVMAHKGEIILSPQESKNYRTSNTSNNITINVSGAGNPQQTARQIKRELEKLDKRWAA